MTIRTKLGIPGAFAAGALLTATSGLAQFGGLMFDGVDDHVTIPGAMALPTATYTVTAWVKTSVPGTVIVGRGAVMTPPTSTDPSAWPWAVTVTAAGNLGLSYENSAGGGGPPMD